MSPASGGEKPSSSQKPGQKPGQKPVQRPQSPKEGLTKSSVVFHWKLLSTQIPETPKKASQSPRTGSPQPKKQSTNQAQKPSTSKNENSKQPTRDSKGRFSKVVSHGFQTLEQANFRTKTLTKSDQQKRKQVRTQIKPRNHRVYHHHHHYKVRLKMKARNNLQEILKELLLLLFTYFTENFSLQFEPNNQKRKTVPLKKIRRKHKTT